MRRKNGREPLAVMVLEAKELPDVLQPMAEQMSAAPS